MLERAASGELREEVWKSHHPSQPKAMEPFCTKSQMVKYLDARGREVARAHRYLRKDGTIGASGLPDPKQFRDGETVYEDRRVTAAEAEALVRAAGQLGLSRADVQVAHRTYLAGLVAEAMSDSVITPTERADLELVTELLGLSTAALEALLAGPPPTVVPRAGGPQASELVGKSVCFTGEITALYQGERITRVMAEGLAVQAGLQVLPRVTKKLDILVVADPDTMSLKAQAAIRNGTRIMAQAAFWKAIGVAVV